MTQGGIIATEKGVLPRVDLIKQPQAVEADVVMEGHSQRLHAVPVGWVWVAVHCGDSFPVGEPGGAHCGDLGLGHRTWYPAASLIVATVAAPHSRSSFGVIYL